MGIGACRIALGFIKALTVVGAVRVLRPRWPFRPPAPVSRARHNPLTGRAVAAGAVPPLRGYKPPALAALAPAYHFFSAPHKPAHGGGLPRLARSPQLRFRARGASLALILGDSLCLHLEPCPRGNSPPPANVATLRWRPFLSAGAMNNPSESGYLYVVALRAPMR